MFSSMDKQQLNGFASSPTSPETVGGGGGGDSGDRATAVAAGPPPHPTFIGKHRMAASISNLQNQIDILQKELTELETVGGSSIVCQELIASVESLSDPLLPWTKGPADAGWDRWFRGAHNSRSHNRWI